jgi:hypothetical protein
MLHRFAGNLKPMVGSAGNSILPSSDGLIIRFGGRGAGIRPFEVSSCPVSCAYTDEGNKEAPASEWNLVNKGFQLYEYGI